MPDTSSSLSRLQVAESAQADILSPGALIWWVVSKLGMSSLVIPGISLW